MRWPWKKRYDPWPDLRKRVMVLNRQILTKATSGEFSPEQTQAAMGAVKSVYENYTIYATVGKDRKKLGPEWVTGMERDACEAVDFALRLDFALRTVGEPAPK